MHLPPQDSVPVASLADGSATFFDGGPLGEVDVLLGGAPGFRDGGAVYAKFRGALYLAADYRDQDSVYVSDANNSCIRRVRFRRRQDCGRGPSHAAAPWPELRGRRRYYTVEYADAETLAGRCGPAADAPPAPAGSARRLGVPAGLVVHDGALYVADAGDHVIRRVALPPPPPPPAPPPPAHGSRCKPPPPLPPAAPPSPPPPPDDALAAPVVAGVAGVAGSSDGDGDARRATFRAPLGVAMAAGGVLYVADTGNHCVRSLRLGDDSAQAAGGGTTTVVGRCGEPGSDGGLLREPSAVLWDDSRDELLIADSGNGCVRALHKGNLTTVFGRCGGGNASALRRPVALALDVWATDLPTAARREAVGQRSADWALFISDSGRIVRVDAGGGAAVVAASEWGRYRAPSRAAHARASLAAPLGIVARSAPPDALPSGRRAQGDATLLVGDGSELKTVSWGRVFVPKVFGDQGALLPS